MKTWASAASLRLAAGEPVALITIVAAAGSTPRDAGTVMLVTPRETQGTIGGGALEHRAIAQARALLASPRPYVLQDYPLGPLLNQCCGGHVQLLIEALTPASLAWLDAVAEAEDAGTAAMLRTSFSANGVQHALTAVAPSGCFAADGTALKRLALRPDPGDCVVQALAPLAPDVLLFGAGHVGRALAPILATLPFRTIWLDDRADGLPRIRPPGVICIDRDIAAAVDRLNPGNYVLVMTHDHEFDYRLVRQVLARGDTAYCGLIASATKAARFRNRLARDGVDADGLTAPLGVKLSSKEPAVIAVAAAAELLAVHDAHAKASLAHRMTRACAC